MTDAGMLKQIAERLQKLERRAQIQDTQDALGNLTAGAVLYVSSTGTPKEDHTDFFWEEEDNVLHIGGTSTIQGTPRLAIKGVDSDGATGPHFQTNTAADTYPLMHFLSYTHDNMEITFDGYYDPSGPAWKSSDAGSNFQIRKNADTFGIWYDSGVAQGGTIGWNEALRIGITGIVSTIGDMRAFGNFVSRKSNVDYTGYIFHPLTSPLTSTSFDGDSFSTTAKTLIDLSTAFSAPAGVKAVLVTLQVRDSGSTTADTVLILGPTNTANAGMITVADRSGNDRLNRATIVVPCDANGDIYYQVVASGASTFDVFMQIWGYWI